MKTLSSMITPSQTNEWLDILQFFPTVAFFWISTKAPIFVLSPMVHPYRLINFPSLTFSPSRTSAETHTRSSACLFSFEVILFPECLPAGNSELLYELIETWPADLQFDGGAG